ncbi:MAG: hypothetical protein LBR97_03815 [Dysgonamonadaceae bacterium]|jgi:hypothetical protein|nr:hypothetical protein [Dysgonamonadaceae bacterium]
MLQNSKSEGKCLFCGETFVKSNINRHIQSHLKQKAKENVAGHSYLIKVEPNPKWGSSSYFLSLWVDGNTRMKDIDQFLRDIWLECCWHMSAFTNPKNRRQGGGMWNFFTAQELLAKGKTREYEKLMEETNGEVPKSRKVVNVLSKGLKLEYEYDFGSSTELMLTVIEEYPVKADEGIVLLSRNEPLEWLCDACKKEPATQLCTVHNWDENSLFCDKCAKKHAKTCADFEEYASMPVVNSPRMGVCAYEGGTIDIERDGAFVKQS